MKESMVQTNPIENGFSIEERVYSNGHHHLYLKDPETGKLKSTSWKAVADSYGVELGQQNLNGSLETPIEPTPEIRIEENPNTDLTDEQKLRDHANWYQRVNTTDTKPSERGLTGEDLAYNAWLKENAPQTSSRTLRQKIADYADKARLDSMRDFARLEMRVKTGAASGEDAAYYYKLKENYEEDKVAAAVVVAPVIAEKVLTPIEHVTELINELNQLAEDGKISWDEYAKKLSDYQKADLGLMGMDFTPEQVTAHFDRVNKNRSIFVDKWNASQAAANPKPAESESVEDQNSPLAKSAELRKELEELAAQGKISWVEYEKKLGEYKSNWLNAVPDGLSPQEEQAYIDRLDANIGKATDLFYAGRNMPNPNGTNEVAANSGEALKDAHDRLNAARKLFREAGDDADKRAQAIEELRTATNAFGVLNKWDTGELNLQNKRFKTSYGEELFRPGEDPSVNGGQDHTAVLAPEQHEGDTNHYEAKLSAIRDDIRVAKAAGDTEALDELLMEMSQLVLERAEEVGADQDWVDQELLAQRKIMAQEHEQANAEMPKDKKRSKFWTAVGGIALAAAALFVVGKIAYPDGDKPKSNVPAATSTVPATDETSTSPTTAGSEAVQKLAEGQTVSHLALESLRAQGNLSDDASERLAQIHIETQRILDLNNVSWEDARNLDLDIKLKV